MFTQEALFTRKWFLGGSCIRIELDFEERGKSEKNLSEQRKDPTTNLTHIWSAPRVRDLNITLHYITLHYIIN